MSCLNTTEHFSCKSLTFNLVVMYILNDGTVYIFILFRTAKELDV